MLIDWFTVGAQVLNFVVLVWLMKHFLYQPVLDAIDAREQRIAAELADADAKKTEARTERDTFQKKNADFDQQRAALMAQANASAQASSAQLMATARTAAEALRRQRQATLADEAAQLHQAIGQRTQSAVFAIARKVLADLAGAALEEQAAAQFIVRLRALDATALSGLAAAFKTSGASGLVRSAFELPPPQQAVIQQAVNQVFAADLPLRFETAPQLVSGIELSVGGQKLAWSIGGYLQSLESGVAEVINAQGQAVPGKSTPGSTEPPAASSTAAPAPAPAPAPGQQG